MPRNGFKKVPVKRHRRKYKSGQSITIERHNRLVKSFRLSKSKIERLKKGKAIGLRERDHIKGGLADNIPDSMFDLEQIKVGKKVEMEHTENPVIAKEITKDHLVENDNYYDYLEEMEDKMKEKNNKK